jgi:tetratricopeptide (TPR) repeat protein
MAPAARSGLAGLTLLGSLIGLAMVPSRGASATREDLAGVRVTANAELLVVYFEGYVTNRDEEVFERNVAAHYTEEALAHLMLTGRPMVRQAAVLGLGRIGGYRMNAVVARALQDEDPTVRGLAEMALWSIWFRSDTPENNATLRQVSGLIEAGRSRDAELLATRLIAKAPTFAEAYNQRAIARWKLGRLGESIEDCKRVLERNPYHIGALSGMGQCHWRLGQQQEALNAFRRAARLQPRNENLREQVQALEQFVAE